MFFLAMDHETQAALLGLAIALVCVIAALLLMYCFKGRFKSTKQVLQEWADEHMLEILDTESRWFRRGPFTFWFAKRSTIGQSVFRITVRDKVNGRTRTGYVRIGGFTGLGNYVKVAWDEYIDDDE
ncbi:MAG: hypothetical protein KAV00_10345 [Phycisphaerae bacterium]|nr:hypothetical protein [Phycisphaerae bacterium]